MSLRQLQTVLARLCLDRSFRSQVTSNPGALQRYELTAGERRAISEIDHVAVGAFGEHLIEKRVRLIMQWFPLTFDLLRAYGNEQRAIELLAGFTQQVFRTDSEVGGFWLRTESRRAGEYLKTLAVTGVIETPHLVDIVAFELDKLRLCADPESAQSASHSASIGPLRPDTTIGVPLHVSVLHMNCDVAELTRAIEARTAHMPIESQPSAVLLIRQAGTTEVDTFMLGDGSAAVLAACRRPVSCRAAVATACLALDVAASDDLSEECWAELHRLIGLGALVPMASESSDSTTERR